MKQDSMDSVGKPVEEQALRHDQLQTEAVFSLHAALQAEYLWKHGIASP